MTRIRRACRRVPPCAFGCLAAVGLATTFAALSAAEADSRPSASPPAVDAARATVGGDATQLASAEETRSKKAQAKKKEPPAAKEPVALNPQKTVWLDRSGGRVLLDTEVVLREGLLEMLCCLKRTKEHESILAVDAKAATVHAGLLALGIEPGSPVRFDPEFRAPQGPRIDIFLQWTDSRGKLHRVPAQKWIRHAIHRFYVAELARRPDDLKIPEDSDLRYDAKHKELSWYGPMSPAQRDALLALSRDEAYRKAIRRFYKESQPREMTAHWVFAGSGFEVDRATGRRHYRAEGGDLICVANFPSATIDVAIQSSASGQENLLFEAYTERIPPVGTKVTVELIPRQEDKPKR